MVERHVIGLKSIVVISLMDQFKSFRLWCHMSLSHQEELIKLLFFDFPLMDCELIMVSIKIKLKWNLAMFASIILKFNMNVNEKCKFYCNFNAIELYLRLTCNSLRFLFNCGLMSRFSILPPRITLFVAQ